MFNSLPMPTYFAAALIAMFAAGCGSDKKGDSASTSPEVVETDLDQPLAQGAGYRMNFKSNVLDAAFKCQIIVAGRESEWKECKSGDTLSPQPGVETVFKVKAITKNGFEDPTPAAHTFPASGNGSGGDGSSTNFAAEIIGKGELTSDWTKQGLTLNFGVKGGSVAANQVSFQCKRDTESQFAACPDGSSYTFSNLQDGRFGLTVRAVQTQTGVISAEDTVFFNVKLASLTVTGEEQLKQATSGRVNLTFDQQAIQDLNLTCRTNSSQAVACNSGYDVDLSSLQAGNHTVVIEARRAGVLWTTHAIPFCTGAQCGGSGPVATPVPTLQIGDSYSFSTPPGMHVTSYGTSQTYNARFNFLQILDDKYFVGLYNCSSAVDRLLDFGGYKYCNMTPSGDFFAWLTQGTIARNHIEVATNASIVDSNPAAHTRVTLNLYDSVYEFQYVRSRFANLCRAKRSTITRTPKIALSQSFWAGQLVGAEFLSCVADISGLSSPFPGSQEKWWVGTFFISTSGFELPSYDCFSNYDFYTPGVAAGPYAHCGSYRNPRLLEVTVMSRKPLYEPSEFARDAQELFLNSLRQIVPMAR